MVMEFVMSVSIHMEMNISQKSKFKHHLVPVFSISNKNWGCEPLIEGQKVYYIHIYMFQGEEKCRLILLV